MNSFLEAVRLYFEEKNRAWLTGSLQSLQRAARAKPEAGWFRRIGYNIDVKRRSARWRQGKLLRAHTRIRIYNIQYKPDTSAKWAEAAVEESITWVYRDGLDYGVESRVIAHLMQWRWKDGKWRLDSDMETDERHPLAFAREAERPAKPLPMMTIQRHVERTTCNRYDRVKALRYAELWWNAANPDFVKLEDDCTNFISQCLFAGNLPMTGQGHRGTGWWYQFDASLKSENWSYSWTTSQALYLHLLAKAGAVRVDSAQDLKIGDVVFYDWDGSGKYHHTTIVTDFDNRGDPLVNAHTDASWHRHYLYLDSRAWTQRTRYAFVHLPDQIC
ncbi:amidase domain-containing protein [Alicyclobacillus tolerans]|uniref:amidase domain-containing protein n=1 Tax=Alicyclobacillus tolerans TaxID=90970 RepID=UPI001F259DE3|nr:amidase domain-containing protein [Alicyclobacillus tolerans]MCF8563888.1 amidase domain-containing protein [Alicyclobacillus tolerans]